MVDENTRRNILANVLQGAADCVPTPFYVQTGEWWELPEVTKCLQEYYLAY